MRTPRRRRLLVGLLLSPLLAGCFAAGGDDSDSSSDAGSGSRLRVALAFPPAENLSPYGADATLLSRLGVTEGLTALDANGSSRARARRVLDPQGRPHLAVHPARGQLSRTAPTSPRPPSPPPSPGPPGRSPSPPPSPASPSPRRPPVTDGYPSPPPSPTPCSRCACPAPASPCSRPRRSPEGSVDPVGTATGPFELTKTSGSTAATLDRFDDYWGGRAQAAGIDARFIADGTARANALRTGQVDIAEAISVAQAASLDKAVRRETATARTTSLHLNTRTGVFKDAKLRAAARAAVDTSAIADGVYEGHADAVRGIYGPALTWAEGKRVQPTGRAKAAAPKGASVTLAAYDNRPKLPKPPRCSSSSWRRPGPG